MFDLSLSAIGGSVSFGALSAGNISISFTENSVIGVGSLAASGLVRLAGASLSGLSLDITASAIEIGTDLSLQAASFNSSSELSFGSIAMSIDTFNVSASGLSLLGTTLTTQQASFTSTGAVQMLGATVAGNLDVLANGSAVITGSTLTGDTGALHAQGISIGGASTLVYAVELDLDAGAGELEIADSTIGAGEGSTKIGGGGAVTMSALGNLRIRHSMLGATSLTLESRGANVLLEDGTQLNGGPVLLRAAGLVSGGNSVIDASALGVQAGGAIDFSASRLRIGSGASGLAGDSAMLELLAQRNGTLLPGSLLPSAAFIGSDVRLGEMSLTGPYLHQRGQRQLRRADQLGARAVRAVRAARHRRHEHRGPGLRGPRRRVDRTGR